ncbi:hypothetical protein BDV38DRAFT_266931 [Aspergillus pseudotamarii]|uniref:Zn(2)-C6 fungal-type domain-containing protein n=1 Tax=Aspergillus pseudotamarii TaxID=132259 RepID=A0A5N6TBW5_ASPPS|nr:uncharacterized protein BDV38DRAFT_266931 [Aspergillus pseudotamarii]KAE8143792.1 hypothetical protein BDV38DRAFT_266931 [Aspergillus pseudotamarii]
MEMSTQTSRTGPVPPKRRSKSRCKLFPRIKCDEQVPFCGPCLKRGFSCPGYQQPMKWRHLDGSGQSTQKPGGEAHRKHSSEDGTDTCTQIDSVKGIRKPRESAPSIAPTTSDTSVDTNERQRDNGHDITTESHELGHIADHGYSSSSCLFTQNFLNDLATEDIWNVGNDVMESLPANSILDAERLCPLFKPLDDKTIILSTHYFSNVCPINSCFDSHLNPLRSVIADLMNSSQLVFHVVMMTSASHLCHQQKEMISVARQHRRDVISYLIENRHVTEKGRFEAILGSVLLGMTSAWQDSSALGISHIHTARALFQQSTTGPKPSNDPQSTSFLAGIMAYWEAMVSIITPQCPRSLDYLAPFCEQENHDTLVYPNPWTGASTTIFIYAAQVNALCHQNRLTKYLSTSIHSTDVRESISHEQSTKAGELEEKVLHYSPPISSRIGDADDRFTPVSHFQCLAQIYRFSVLVQLYLTFPNLLDKSNTTMSTLDTEPSYGTIQRSPNETVVGLAVNILNLISSVPESSGIKVLLTVPLIIAGSALQKVQGHNKDIGIPHHTTTFSIEQEILSLHCSDSMILHWRSLVRHKLKVLHECIGLDPILRASQILEAVWIRSDLTVSNRTNASTQVLIHWLDVMVEERLESIFG